MSLFSLARLMWQTLTRVVNFVKATRYNELMKCIHIREDRANVYVRSVIAIRYTSDRLTDQTA